MALTYFFLYFFLFSLPRVAKISLTEVWCAEMGIITFGMICVEQALKYGQEKSFCVGLRDLCFIKQKSKCFLILTHTNSLSCNLKL